MGPSRSHRSNRSLGNDSDFDDAVMVAVVAFAKATVALIWASVLFPMISIPTITSAWIAVNWGPLFGLVATAFWVPALLSWFLLSPKTFHEWVTVRLRVQWRTWGIYRSRWGTVCKLCGLTAALDGRVMLPTLCSVTVGVTSDVLEVRILTGQSLTDWQSRGDALAEALSAERVTIHSIRPGWISITTHHGDPLTTPIRLPHLAADAATDLSRLCVGVTEAGERWRLPILGQHVLVAGATGSGKGSVLWSIIAAVAPAMRTGSVRVAVVDPKGGMEFGRGQALFAALAHDNGVQTLSLLRAVVAVMQKRAQRLRGKTRLHTPTAAAPLIILVVDEIASLTAYVGDRKMRVEAEQLLGLLLSQGRAVGISVIAAVQDPSKDVLPLRQLFSIRVGLRMSEATQTTMVLGTAARDAGALCDRISTSTPGVGYVCKDGNAEPLRVRAFYVTDPDIDDLASRFSPVRAQPRPIENGNRQP
ncbi:FtsK/SpoIIIE domain-containing protein [Mycobacterium marinum]|uniref:FtsK/SpoIIIE domain-containing protein n=1 Tax=Mycobacterium marinum TaxID=1781 RepID=UPI003B42DBBB